MKWTKSRSSYLTVCLQEVKLPHLLTRTAKFGLKQDENWLEIVKFGNLAKPKDSFFRFYESLLVFS